ncbi:MAG: prolyl-tRNA synthetase associated domain-containing protein [Alphaproteobacteria bacterium]|nr:prolyl-tRNA synthetase associated domain-containing protein [Alphaproteobacteria bacterium]
MPHTRESLIAILDELAIKTTTVDHEPAFTVDDVLRMHDAIPAGVNVKNLFLKDAKGALWLVSAPFERTIDLKALPNRIGCKRVSFGSPALLMETLGVIPGAVTPFAPVNDTARRVRVVLDAEMMRAETLNAHPLVNTATTNIRTADLLRFLRHVHDDPLVAELGD